MTLPDCPHPGCDANQTLSAFRSEPRGVRVCVCSCCGKECRVDAAGAVVWLPDVRDVQGVVMYDP
jgi:hypothetical protein